MPLNEKQLEQLKKIEQDIEEREQRIQPLLDRVREIKEELKGLAEEKKSPDQAIRGAAYKRQGELKTEWDRIDAEKNPIKNERQMLVVNRGTLLGMASEEQLQAIHAAEQAKQVQVEQG